MDKFQIIQPSKLLRSYVKQYWFLKIDNAGLSSQRYIPSGCAVLVFHRGERIYSTFHREVQPRSSLCGQSTYYTDIVYSDNLNLISIVFHPIAARAVFDVPMDKLRDQNIDLALLGDSALIALEKQLMEIENNDQCVCLIEQYLLKRLYGFTSDRFDRMNAVLQSIDGGQENIIELSQIACLGYKQFKRVFAEYMGLNPKEFLRLIRLRKVLYALHAESQTHLNQLAFDWGYCDKSHLIKDFKSLIGYTPKEYLSISDPYSEYMSLFNSIFINGECNTKYNKS